jgi:ribosomal protein S27E
VFNQEIERSNMARVKCPQCGTERVVVDGKRKNCRKCGTKLTADMAQVKPRARKTAKASRTAGQQSEAGAGSSNPPTE